MACKVGIQKPKPNPKTAPAVINPPMVWDRLMIDTPIKMATCPINITILLPPRSDQRPDIGREINIATATAVKNKPILLIPDSEAYKAMNESTEP